MKRSWPWSVPVAAAAVWLGCVGSGCGERAVEPPRRASPPTSAPAAAFARVREPAVAGLFYPKQPDELGRTIDQMLNAAAAPSAPNLKALICPHAGYVYSGPTAAVAYKAAAGRDFSRVVVLAVSHYALFSGAYVPDVDGYQTPLGTVAVSEMAGELAKLRPFTREPQAQVQRPAWWAQSSRPPPAEGADTPDTWEHSGEVQVPFLQKALKGFKLVPVVFGETDPALAARVLAGQIDDRTLVIASSDLSHYHSYDEAKKLDKQCVQAILDLDLKRMQNAEACGKLPILTLLHLARLKGWKPMLLDYRNSGDTAGDKGRVVGYTAVAFCAPAPGSLSPAERKFLIDLARKTLQEVVARKSLPAVEPAGLSAMLTGKKGCFVTLTKKGVLRGCIGHILPQEPLYQAVLENARNSATRDFRFEPVRPEELGEIEIEISVLTEPQPLEFRSPEDLLARLQPRRDGVVLQIGSNRATYLPQVWEQIPDKVAFLNSLAQKAGCEPADWRKPGTLVSTYQVEAFKERAP